jgi:hypothetical protein
MEVFMRLFRCALFIGMALVVASVSVFGTGPTGDPALDALWGKDITVRELAGGAPAGASEKMLNTKVTWGGPGTTHMVAHYVGTTAAGAGPVSTEHRSGPTTGSGLYILLATAVLGLSTLVIAIRSPLRRMWYPI